MTLTDPLFSISALPSLYRSSAYSIKIISRTWLRRRQQKKVFSTFLKYHIYRVLKIRLTAANQEFDRPGHEALRGLHISPLCHKSQKIDPVQFLQVLRSKGFDAGLILALPVLLLAGFDHCLTHKFSPALKTVTTILHINLQIFMSLLFQLCHSLQHVRNHSRLITKDNPCQF